MLDIQDHPETREVIEAYYADVAAGRYVDAAGWLAPEATLWIVGEGHWPLGGLHDVEGNKEIYATVKDRFPAGFRIDLKGLIVEGDRAAVEVETHGVRRDGKVYNNKYHYVIVVRDGKICSRREYLDTIHANEMLCGDLDL